MHVVYLCNFNLKDAVGGKDRATRQKIEALEKQSSKFKAYYLSKDGELYNVIMSLWLDLCCGFYILYRKPDFFISRGSVGYFSLLMAKLVGAVSAREVHAISSNETHLLPFGKGKKLLLKYYFKIFRGLQRLADVRIFNHPFLLEHYQQEGRAKENDFFCYNGYSPSSVNNFSEEDVYEKYGLSADQEYLVFTGSVSKWHGVDYLISLQEEFNKHGDSYQIIIAGGNSSVYDPDSLCVNISPLNDVGCSEILTIASLCLLPVKNNRISPGSPLKLYDYIGHKKYVIAEDIAGYSDEVENYQVGIAVDFTDAVKTRKEIIKYLDQIKLLSEKDYPLAPVTWDDRVAYWLDKLKASQK